MKRIMTAIIVSLVMVAGVLGSDADYNAEKTIRQQSESAFKALEKQFPGIKKYVHNDRTTRLYGREFSFGTSPYDAAENFKNDYAEIFSARSEELLPLSRVKGRGNMLPMMYNSETDDYKFTLVYYSQHRNAIPVFRSELRVLVRNEAEYSVVLAASSLRNLGDFSADRADNMDPDRIRQAVQLDNPDLDKFDDAELCIWAGIDDMKVRPTLAARVEAYNDFQEAWLYLVDIETDEILYKENLILFENVTGVANGVAIDGTAAEHCDPVAMTTIPYAEVKIGSQRSFTSNSGNFEIPYSGSDPVEVELDLFGQYFQVYDLYGRDLSLTQTVTPPGPAVFLYNSENTEFDRANVTAYVLANHVRDMLLDYVPNYPAVSTQTDLPVYCNRYDLYCPTNAWYNRREQSMSFCHSYADPFYPNTAFQQVVFHEYGHHVIYEAGSGQGQYGEGMSDCIAMMRADEAAIGIGFFGDCEESLRNADNEILYPCSNDYYGIHYCGQLLSGSVWETRNELTVNYPDTYLDILRNLVFHSILLHTGTLVTPQITIDFLTLDDDDGNLDNGTPHYMEICNGFAEHGMDYPDMAPVFFSYPDGLPEGIFPATPHTFDFEIVPNTGNPVAGSASLHYAIDDGEYIQGTVTETSPGYYNATLPGILCNSIVKWYITVDVEGYGLYSNPRNAPEGFHTSFPATDTAIVFEDDFETDKGWTITGGNWERGAPSGGGGSHGNPDPAAAYSGSNVFGYNLAGDYEDNMYQRHLTSPVINCTNMSNVNLKFQRWLGVEDPMYDHAYVSISNDGYNWVTIWENSEEVADNEWTEVNFDISQVADNSPTVYLRWTMGTTDNLWRYCGWNIDDVVLTAYNCSPAYPIILTTSVPDWTRGIEFSLQLEALYGTGSYTWVDKYNDLNGTGLTLSPSGLLSGIPVISGPVTLTAQVTDEAMVSSEKQYSFYINPEVAVTTSSVPDWTVGVEFFQQLESSGGTGITTWVDKFDVLSGTGLILSESGQISGTPSVAGGVELTVQASDSVGSQDEHQYDFTLNPVVVIISESLPDGYEGDFYSQQLISTGGTGTISWTDINGVLDGTGLTLTPGGLLSGTPVAFGDGNIELSVSAADEVGSDDQTTFTFVIGGELQITTEDVPDWTENQSYMVQLFSFGGIGSKTWVNKNYDLFGTGLSLTEEGVVFGAPNSPGHIIFTVIVIDEALDSVESVFDLLVNPEVEIITATLPDGLIGDPYSFQLESSGGTGQILWSDLNNDLDTTGLILQEDGLLIGIPEIGGEISFTARAVDITGSSKTRLFVLNIAGLYICGDFNNDGSINIKDITFLISYLYKGGPAPESLWAADVDGSGEINMLDITYLITFLYKDGPDPACP